MDEMFDEARRRILLGRPLSTRTASTHYNPVPLRLRGACLFPLLHCRDDDIRKMENETNFEEGRASWWKARTFVGGYSAFSLDGRINVIRRRFIEHPSPLIGSTKTPEVNKLGSHSDHRR